MTKDDKIRNLNFIVLLLRGLFLKFYYNIVAWNFISNIYLVNGESM